MRLTRSATCCIFRSWLILNTVGARLNMVDVGPEAEGEDRYYGPFTRELGELPVVDEQAWSVASPQNRDGEAAGAY